MLPGIEAGVKGCAEMKLGFITGTGFYELPALEDLDRLSVETPYGVIELTLGTWHGHEVAFLPRHGPTHSIAPSKINYRANLWGLNHLGSPLYSACVSSARYKPR